MTRRIWITGLLATTALLPACTTGGGCPDSPGIACAYVGTGALGLSPDGLDRRSTDLYWALDMEFAPDGTAYLIDWNNHLIRRVLEDQTVETVVGDFVGDGPPDMGDLMAPGADGLTVSLNHPTDLQFDDQGHLIFAAWHNHKIRVWDPETGLCYVMGGRGATYAGDGGPVSAARFNQPKALVRARDGTLYLLDQRSFRVRRIGPDGMVTTIAGTGQPGYSGDGGLAIEATLRFEAGPNPEPSGALALSADESTLYIADGLNYRIRRLTLSSGIIDTVVGTGQGGYAGDGGPGNAALISHVRDMEVGPDGKLYIADTENHRIRAWDPTTGIITTVVGNGREPRHGDRPPEGLPALETSLNRPMGIAFGPDGAMYVGDTFHSRFLRIPGE